MLPLADVSKIRSLRPACPGKNATKFPQKVATLTSVQNNLFTMMKFALAATLLAPSVLAQSSCTASCKGTTSDGTNFDLSALMGQDYQTTGSDQNADTYFLNVCGTSATQCPDDAGDPPVTQGTAVQTVAAGGCYVLGVRSPRCWCCSLSMYTVPPSLFFFQTLPSTERPFLFSLFSFSF